MKAMILAAGYGARLWPLTADRTKPALPVLGKPLVGYVAEYLAQQGIEDVIVNLHHRPDSVRLALGDGSQFGVRLQYVHEPVILGTSGALDNAREMIGAETFVVINGKLITDIDLRAVIETHQRTGALATLALRRNVARERFSIVETVDGFVTRFGGMPAAAAASDSVEAEAPLMFTGIQVMDSRIFDYIPPGVFSHTTIDVFPRAIAKGERIAAHIGEGMWFELSTLQRYLDISLALLNQRGSDLYTGRAASIDPEANVRESILWDDVIVERGARVRRAILGDGVRVRAGEEVEDAAVVRAELVFGVTPPAKAPKGYAKGDTFVVPLSQ
ncbi:MAG TPA: NDP-sugar synthase [Pyrinomonadaceae bacterium]|nr:NDP-sugar synthase [Pyrinomonadaceae bacterium]